MASLIEVLNNMNNDITLDSSNISSDDSFIKTFNIEINNLSDIILDESGLYHYSYYLIIYLVIPPNALSSASPG